MFYLHYNIYIYKMILILIAQIWLFSKSGKETIMNALRQEINYHGSLENLMN